MRYVIGIDGGQTSTTAVLADETGGLLGVGCGGPANHIHEPGGVERVRKSLCDAIVNAKAAAGKPDAAIACAYLGMTGGGPAMEEVCNPAVDAVKMVLGHDSVIALYSVTFGKPGVVVIGGTGSVAYGRNAHGDEYRAGGWGYLMGDEGSGYWIGLQALNAISQSQDGRAGTTLLTNAVMERFKCGSIWDLHRKLYSGEIDRPAIAGISAVVGQVAEKGDSVAQTILAAAGTELGRLASVVLAKLNMVHQTVEIGYVGGVFRAGDWVKRPFADKVHQAAPQAQVIPARIPAAAAAVLLALEQIGVAIDNTVITHMKTSVSQHGKALK